MLLPLDGAEGRWSTIILVWTNERELYSVELSHTDSWDV